MIRITIRLFSCISIFTSLCTLFNAGLHDKSVTSCLVFLLNSLTSLTHGLVLSRNNLLFYPTSLKQTSTA